MGAAELVAAVAGQQARLQLSAEQAAVRAGCAGEHPGRLPDGRSTLDLFGPWFTLLTGPEYTRPEMTGEVVRQHRLDDSGAGPYRLAARGAVLVRPDGHVAWRAARDEEHPPDLCPGRTRQSEV